MQLVLFKSNLPTFLIQTKDKQVQVVSFNMKASFTPAFARVLMPRFQHACFGGRSTCMHMTHYAANYTLLQEVMV